MKKLLYITDQQEYSERGTIGPLFHDYLKEQMTVHTVYVTKYKDSFQAKGEDFVVPVDESKDIISYLEIHGIDIFSYHYVFVRNKEVLLRAVLNAKPKYNYKVGFRVSFPKTVQKQELLKIQSSFKSTFKRFALKYERYKKAKLINECDIFMPGSLQMRDTFFPGTTTKTFPLQVGIDPKTIVEHPKFNEEVKRFIYVGTADTLRDIEAILIAFSNLQNKNWHLTFSTANQDYILSLLSNYSNIAQKVSVKRSVTLKDVGEHINEADISLALMPNLPIFDTILPAKAVDGYGHTIPCILSENELNRSVFEEDEAFFCKFEPTSIAKKLEEIIEMPSDKIAKVAKKGQQKLLSMERNYQNMAKSLADELSKL